MIHPAGPLLAAAFFANAAKLPPPYPAVEDDAGYREREAVITTAAANVAREIWPDTALAKYHGDGLGQFRIGNALLSLTYGETRWAFDLHAGLRLGDGGKAACLGQLHESSRIPHRIWAELAEGGTDLASTEECLRYTAQTLISAMKYCGSGWTEEGLARAYSLYGTGMSCHPTPWARHRARRWALMVAGKKPTGIASLAMLEAEAVDSERVKELPSLPQGPPGWVTVPGLFSNEVVMRAVTGSPDSHIIETLSELLERARAGEVTSFVSVSLDSEGLGRTAVHTHSRQLPKLHFALSAVASDLLKLGEEDRHADRG